MNPQRLFPCFVLTLGLLAPACSVETIDEQPNDDSIDVPLDTMGGPSDPQDSPPGSGNGFAPACETRADVLAGYRKYAPQRLWNPTMGTTYGTLPANSAMDLVPAACRAQALKYLIRCALPRDTFAIDPLTGARYWGWLNLAPNWRTSPLVSDEQWWVTACVFQHVNGLGAEVPILLDGAKAGLYSPTAAHPVFQKRDSRIWGNMFTGTGEFVPNVCYENDLLNSCSEFNAVDTRLCDTDPTLNCNLNIVGPCSMACYYSFSAGGYSCGSGGMKNIGSRLKDFSMYGTMCLP
jgi:hypothetical protein